MGREESVFLKGMTTGKLTTLQRMDSYPRLYGQHKLNLRVFAVVFYCFFGHDVQRFRVMGWV